MVHESTFIRLTKYYKTVFIYLFIWILKHHQGRTREMSIFLFATYFLHAYVILTVSPGLGAVPQIREFPGVICYLLRAFNISMITSVDSAMVGGLLWAKMSQSTPRNLSSWTRHCDWWVWIEEPRKQLITSFQKLCSTGDPGATTRTG